MIFFKLLKKITYILEALSHVSGGLIFQLEAKIKHCRSWKISSMFWREKKL